MKAIIYVKNCYVISEIDEAPESYNCLMWPKKDSCTSLVLENGVQFTWNNPRSTYESTTISIRKNNNIIDEFPCTDIELILRLVNTYNSLTANELTEKIKVANDQRDLSEQKTYRAKVILVRQQIKLKLQNFNNEIEELLKTLQ